MKFIKAIVLVGSFVFGLSNSVWAGGDDPTGVWLTQAGDAKVAVGRSGSMLSGKIVWLKTPIDPATGKIQVDDKNSDPRLAKRRIIGLQLFIGMKQQSPGQWSGKIYNADDGGIYESKVKLLGPGQLIVEGCLGAICGGETWTKLGGR